MPAARPPAPRRSSQGLFIGLSVALLMLGGMVIDPLAALVCFGLAGLFSLIPLNSARGWPRYLSLALLVLALLLALDRFPHARRQHDGYRSGAAATTGSRAFDRPFFA